jgi:hypothetical protein
VGRGRVREGEALSGQPHPKPVKRKRKQIRVIDPKATARAVLTYPRCSLCPKPAATGHHVLPKGSPNFGDDVLANIVSVCGSGTTGCHGEIEAKREWAMRSLGAFVGARRPDTIAYVREKLGVVAGDAWLEKHLRLRVGSPSR